MRKLLLSFLLLLSFTYAHALSAVVAHTVFFLPKEKDAAGPMKAYAEVCWQIDAKSVKYTKTAEGISARIKTDVTITNGGGMVNEDHFVLQTTPRATVQDIASHSIIDLHRYMAGAGLMNLQIRFTDMADTNNKYTYADTFTVQQPADGAFYSGIQLLDTFYKSAESDMFQKSGYRQIPMPANFFDENKHTLNYYIELYNTADITKEEYPLKQTTYISKRVADGTYAKMVHIDTITGKDIVPVLGSFNIESLGSGNYYMNVKLENSLKMVLNTGQLMFQRYNNNPVQDVIPDSAKLDKVIEKVNIVDMGKTFVGKYDLPQLKAILKMLLPVIDPANAQTIRGFLKRPDITYMQYFILNYFKEINKDDPEKAWKEYTIRVREANQLFNAGPTAGYETDRGYVYLRYGKPTDRIIVPNEAGTYPYEVWFYNSVTLKNGKSISDADFLFYKPGDMLADFKLLHTTVAGELRNKAWRSYLFTNSNNADQSSRAEQYIGNR